MKLNYKRTLLVGFAFFLICTFWQAYDTIIPKLLTDRFGMTQTLSGIIMALDNILALFMLPLFGTLSDKCKHKWGKRKPFVFYGTIVAVAALMLLTVSDACQLKLINDATKIDDTNALYVVYDEVGKETIKTPDGDEFVLSEKFSREEFGQIRSKVLETKVVTKRIDYTPVNSTATQENYLIIEDKSKVHFVTFKDDNGNEHFYLRLRNDQVAKGSNEIKDIEILPEIESTDEAFQRAKINLHDVAYEGKTSTIVDPFKECTNAVYTNYVTPARQAHVANITEDSPIHLIAFIAILLVLLVAMSTFRSPAVALMPDVTIKPLRSKANAIINLIGTFGGICVLVLGMGFAFNNSAISNTFRPYLGFFGAVAGIMVVCLIIFMIFVKEPEWSSDMVLDSMKEGIDDTPDEPQGVKGGKLSKGELVSLILILASVALWYFGYNAVTSKYSVYATNVLDLDYSTTLLVANAAAVISYLPVGMIASKVGRKKTILAGVLMLAVAFLIASFMRVDSPAVIMNIMFALAGIGWATINVNSFPMVVELSKNGDIGKYTGYYYAASMAAQALTPFLSGIVMDNFGMTWLFPYGTIFVSLAFITMLFVRHGDSKPEQPKDKLEALGGPED